MKVVKEFKDINTEEHDVCGIMLNMMSYLIMINVDDLDLSKKTFILITLFYTFHVQLLKPM